MVCVDRCVCVGVWVNGVWACLFVWVGVGVVCGEV